MSFTAQVFAALTDALKDAATANDLLIDPAAIFQEAGPVAGRQAPFIAVRLPTDFEKGQWSGAKNQRDSHFLAVVALTAVVPNDGAHPFGDAANPSGILNIYDQVMNAIDNARTALQEATTPNAVLDYQTQGTVGWKEDSTTATIAVTVDFWFRYMAGNR